MARRCCGCATAQAKTAANAASNFSVLVSRFSLVTYVGHHGWCFSASFSVATWLAAQIALGDAFSVEENKPEHRQTHKLCS
jgi:hypothetical protein